MFTRLLATIGAVLMLMFGAVAMPSIAHAAVPGSSYSCSLAPSYNGYATVKANRTHMELAMSNTNTGFSQTKKATVRMYGSTGNYLWTVGTISGVPSTPRLYTHSGANAGMYVAVNFKWVIDWASDRSCNAYYRVT